jgi:hypothetical protein
MKMRVQAIAVTVLALLAASGCSKGEGPGTRPKRSSPVIAALIAATADKGKRDALEKVAETFARAEFHAASIERAAEALARAKHNWDGIAYAAELMGDVGFHTQTILDVAEAASAAKTEIPEFRDMAELAVLRLSGGSKLVELAEWASSLTDGGHADELRTRLGALRDEAECKTIPEAKERVARMMEEIDKSVKKR